MIETVLSDYIDDLPLAVLRSTYYQHDGAPAHRTAAVTRCLTSMFDDRLIGYRTLPAAWPPRSPDLTPMDFFLWGYLKNEVYRRPISNVQELRDRITAACRAIPPAMLANAVRGTVKRARLCIVADGTAFEPERS